MKIVWKSRNADQKSDDLHPLDSQGPIPAAIQRVLAGRGLKDLAQIETFLFPKLQSLKDPYSLMNMDLAVKRLAQAFVAKEKIAIYCDFDLDGTSGLALMMTGLTSMGFENVVPYQPVRLAEGYGFHPEAVEALAADGVSLIVTVDVGITATKAALKASELGVDVIITDHHLPAEVLPVCWAVVNPNQQSDTSGLGYLSGAGVAFYLLRALKRQMINSGLKSAENFELKDVLEYFTIATLTDMVPLIGDNRTLVKHGLIKLSQTEKPGIKALKAGVGLDDRSLTSGDVAIRFAPKLNALSRLGSEILPIDILLCNDGKMAQSLIHRVLDNNQLRVQLQSEAEIEIKNFVAQSAGENLMFMISPKFHRGLVGLMATKMSQESQKPSFVGSLDESTGQVVGSARRPQDFDGCLVEMLTSAKDYLNRFGGHSQAAGFEFEYRHSEKIKTCMTNYFAENFTGAAFKNSERPLFYDTNLEFSEMNPILMKWLEFLGPFGVQFESPVFCFKGVRLQGIKQLRGGHLRLTCINNDGTGVQEALLFSPTDAQRDLMTERSMTYDILGELQWNYYNGQQTIQLLIKDLRVSLWQ